MRFAFTVVLSSIIGFASAVPHSESSSHNSCSLSKAKIPLTPTTLTVPSGVELQYVALGVGTQNYSCSAAGTYASIGAVAKLYDASCEVSLIESIEAKSSGACETGIDAVKTALGKNPIHLGDHYFINNPTGAAGVSPVFDFRAASLKGHCDAYVVLSKASDVPAPSAPTTNVDWLMLSALPNQGTLSTDVFRILTVGGQPPKSCTPGSAPITVPYAATYWFYK